MADTDFLDLAGRSAKPRATGLTHVLDPGIGPAAVDDVIASSGPFIDIWKVGWGTAYVDAALDRKIAALVAADIELCLGGTLLEIAWAQGRAAECLAWARDARVRPRRGLARDRVDEPRREGRADRAGGPRLRRAGRGRVEGTR